LLLLFFNEQKIYKNIYDRNAANFIYERPEVVYHPFLSYKLLSTIVGIVN
jgi:hypothetical protein